jgi:uncharacterized protein (DUF924 family)
MLRVSPIRKSGAVTLGASSTTSTIRNQLNPHASQPFMYQPILDFWFKEITPAQIWKVDPAFDALIASRFGDIHEQATRAELFAWRATPRGRLAEIIVLDQFSRNIHRGTRRAFEADPLALALAQEAVSANADAALAQEERVFLVMPYMHSESKQIHAVAEPFFKANTPESNYNFELRHKAIIDRFGRYPHRNAILGRTSTPEELAFLQEPGSSF